ncbi:MAG: recombinase family protein [Eubacteriales bacterium]
MKSKDDKHKLIVDEEVKPIVERIFSLYIDYRSQSEIARILNQNGILTPSLYRKSKEGKDINTSSKWTFTTIKKILTQPIYTGDMVQGRTKSYSHKVNKRIPLPKDEWVRIEGTHEAIIDKAIFNQVQSMITKNVKPTSGVKPSLFAGLLVCAECGKQMQRSVVSPADKSYSNFVCSTYKKYGKSVCSSHLISEEVIFEILISSLNLLIKSMIDVDTILAAKDSKKKGKKISKLETEISIFSKKRIELKGL